MSQELILTIGCQGSGKSTWAMEYIANHPDVVYLSPDKLRAEFGKGVHDQEVSVYGILKNRLTTALALGKSVLLDATFIKKKWRKSSLDVGKGFKAKTIAHVFIADEKTLIARVRSRAEQGGLNVPVDVIKQYRNLFQMPNTSEFNEVIIHKQK